MLIWKLHTSNHYNVVGLCLKLQVVIILMQCSVPLGWCLTHAFKSIRFSHNLTCDPWLQEWSILPPLWQGARRRPHPRESIDVFSLVVLPSVFLSLSFPAPWPWRPADRPACLHAGPCTSARARSGHCLWLLQLPYWPQVCALHGQLEITFLICGHRRTSMWIVNYGWILHL